MLRSGSGLSGHDDKLDVDGKPSQIVSMAISISYASRRDEVWQWYWRAWRQGLWRTHACVFLITASLGALALYGGWPNNAVEWAIVLSIGLLPLAFFALFPMIKFKPHTRTLVVSESGIDTTVGKLSGTVPWEDISCVREDGGKLIIQRRNLNAFIIPERAFETSEARLEFRDFVQARAPANVR